MSRTINNQGQLSFTYTMPYVTGLAELGSAHTVSPGARTRTLPSRAVRSGDESGASGDVGRSEAPPSQTVPPRMVRSSSVQQANVGITTSLVLTLGKPITVFEDSGRRVRLTVSKLSE